MTEAYQKVAKLKDDLLYTPPALILNQSFILTFSPKDSQPKIFGAFNFEDSVRFAIFNSSGDKVLQQLDPQTGTTADLFLFNKIEGVAFKDVNGDGKIDILTVYSVMHPGPGNAGEPPEYVSSAYLNCGEKFVLSETCSDSKNLKSLEKCAK
jgi:hypothetical protein